MEDPISFGLWTTIVADKKAEGERLLEKARPEMPRLALLQLVNRSVTGGAPISLALDRGWREIQEWSAAAVAVGSPHVYQSGYGPSDDQRLHRCPEHALSYGGVLGCPVHDKRYRE